MVLWCQEGMVQGGKRFLMQWRREGAVAHLHVLALISASNPLSPDMPHKTLGGLVGINVEEEPESA